MIRWWSAKLEPLKPPRRSDRRPSRRCFFRPLPKPTSDRIRPGGATRSQGDDPLLRVERHPARLARLGKSGQPMIPRTQRGVLSERNGPLSEICQPPQSPLVTVAPRLPRMQGETVVPNDQVADGQGDAAAMIRGRDDVPERFDDRRAFFRCPIDQQRIAAARHEHRGAPTIWVSADERMPCAFAPRLDAGRR
jgi:hypothetical protein